MIGQRRDQGVGLRLFQSFDRRAVVAHRIKALSPGGGVRPHDGVANRRVSVDLRLLGRESALAAGEVEHPMPALDIMSHFVGKGVPRGGGARELGIPQGQAAKIGDFQRE